MFDFAYCYDYEKKIQNLARLCPEKWIFSGLADNAILRNYIEHTFLKLQEEENIIKDNDFAVFNTGLYTSYYEQIYAYFVPNKNKDRQPWFFENFYTSYQLGIIEKTKFPKRANYFEHPGDLVFDANCDIVPQYNHIFGDLENLSRIPESVRESPNRVILFDGAIKHTKNMINANYKTAVPQYYKGRIQLLLPLYLTSSNAPTPDLALVVSKNKDGNQYLGHTCLTLDMAYNNARLIARPDSVWLKP